MRDALETFFSAWGAEDAAREARVREALADDATYVDPRGAAQGVEAISDYVAQYGATAPSGAAEVIETSDGPNGATRARVRFHGPGFEQFGLYDAHLDAAGRIARLNGVKDG